MKNLGKVALIVLFLVVLGSCFADTGEQNQGSSDQDQEQAQEEPSKSPENDKKQSIEGTIKESSKPPEPDPEPQDPPEEPDPEPQDPPEEVANLNKVRVLDQPTDGYEREEFGTPWYDEDGNGCDTRQDILSRDVDGAELSNNGCTVMSGTLVDPYTGEEIAYSADEGREVHIDHVVSLSQAWKSGAGSWSSDERRRFANDPANLLAVGAGVNLSKSDSGPSGWLPDIDKCGYAEQYVDVHLDYGLKMPQADYNALERLSC